MLHSNEARFNYCKKIICILQINLLAITAISYTSYPRRTPYTAKKKTNKLAFFWGQMSQHNFPPIPEMYLLLALIVGILMLGWIRMHYETWAFIGYVVNNEQKFIFQKVPTKVDLNEKIKKSPNGKES